jgi:hypothetical protein
MVTVQELIDAVAEPTTAGYIARKGVKNMKALIAELEQSERQDRDELIQGAQEMMQSAEAFLRGEERGEISPGQRERALKVLNYTGKKDGLVFSHGEYKTIDVNVLN